MVLVFLNAVVGDRKASVSLGFIFLYIFEEASEFGVFFYTFFLSFFLLFTSPIVDASELRYPIFL